MFALHFSLPSTSTTDTCNPSTGQCINTATMNCNDLDPCTLDSCDPIAGCHHSLIDSPGCISCGNGVCEAEEEESVCHVDCFCGRDGVCDYSLDSTMAGGNGQAANMFDLEVLEDIVIHKFNINCDTAGSDKTVRIHYKTGSYSDFESDPTAWTRIFSSASVTCEAPGSHTPIVLGSALTLSAGNYAFVVHAEEYLVYTNGSIEGANYASSTHMNLKEGIGKTGEFSGTTFSPRIWNGEIKVSQCATFTSETSHRV